MNKLYSGALIEFLSVANQIIEPTSRCQDLSSRPYMCEAKYTGDYIRLHLSLSITLIKTCIVYY